MLVGQFQLVVVLFLVRTGLRELGIEDGRSLLASAFGSEVLGDEVP